MKYFDTLPTIVSKDSSGYNYTLATNLLARVSIIPSLLLDSVLYYKYDIQDGDTPESIANKYYGDPYRYWIVLFANQILDPQWSWPLNYKQFQVYIEDKYAGPAANANTAPLAYTQSTIYQYRKTIITTDTVTNSVTSNNYVITQNDYVSLIGTSGEQTTYVFPDGSSCIYEVDASIVYIYDWEDEVNEAKRSINIINSAYTGKLEQQLSKLLST